jgi:hypothetical protein
MAFLYCVGVVLPVVASPLSVCYWGDQRRWMAMAGAAVGREPAAATA